MVYVVNDGLQVVASGSGDNHLAGASLDVSHGLVLLGEEAGALQNHVNTQLAPGQLSGVGLGIDGDLLAVHGDRGVVALHSVALVTALSGVVFQQVSQHSGAGQVVDRNDLVALSAEHLTESQTANTTEAIDSNFNCHDRLSSLK